MKAAPQVDRIDKIDIPFTAAAHRYREKVWSKAFTPGAAAVDLSPASGAIKPTGYLRAVWLLVTTSGGSAGTGSPAFAADAPWNLFSEIAVTQPNGQELYGGPLWNGFDAYLAAKHAAWQLCTDPKMMPSASVGASNTHNFQFVIPIIFELDRESALGCLPSQDATAPWKLKLTGNTSANIFTTAPATIPEVTVSVFVESWTVPSPINPITGLRQAIAPPGLGTIQKWTKQSLDLTPSTAMEALLTRKGNAIRTLIFSVRNSSAARVATSNFPAAINFQWDGTQLRVSDDDLLIVDDDYQVRGGAAGSTPQTADTGVLVLRMTDHSGLAVQGASTGFGLDEFWGTVQSSVLGMSGTWGSSAETLEVLTNDVQVVSLAGNPYAFAYGPYLQAPAQPSART